MLNIKEISGNLKGKGKRVAIVASRFNEFITKRLVDGCLNELSRLKVRNSDITVSWVPGAYEIPLVALQLAKKKDVDAVICLGAVIRGETYHFELVAQGVASGISDVSLSTGKPIIFEVLTTDTVNQAYKRSEEDGDNKGKDGACAAIEMIDILSQLKKK